LEKTPISNNISKSATRTKQEINPKGKDFTITRKTKTKKKPRETKIKLSKIPLSLTVQAISHASTHEGEPYFGED
jgi:hypothetical protein